MDVKYEICAPRQTRTREENVTDTVQQTKPTEQNSSWEAKVVKKTPLICGTWRFITAFTTVRHR